MCKENRHSRNGGNLEISSQGKVDSGYRTLRNEFDKGRRR